MQKKYPRFFTALRIALAVVFIGAIGTIAGILGGLISPQVFLPEDIIQLRPIIFEDKTAARKTEKETNISDIVHAIAPSIGKLYRVSAKNTAKDFGTDLLPFAKDFLGYALVGSADGWILLPPSLETVRTGDIRFIDSEKRIFKIETRISDPATDMQYARIRLPEESTLKPAQFDTTVDIGASKRVIELIDARGGVSFDLTPMDYPPAQTLSEAIQHANLLKKRFNASQKFSTEGVPFVTEKKEVIGLATANGILPMAYVQDSFAQVLRSKKIQRPTLTLQYVDLSLLPISADIRNREVLKNGAYIIAQKRPVGIAGPSGMVRFAHGDIVVSVNSEILDSSKNLSEILQQYKPGNAVGIEYLHAGEKKTTSVTLQ
ncbi:serine protease [Candidatus Uhrbacteria bacterium]|nr:serine protease [Candidatus Uhrbacteria bacterium]